MPAEREVIDLDEHNHQSAAAGSIGPDRRLARRKMSIRLVAAFVVGVVLGGFGVSELRDSREERERNASVALVALPASVGSGGDVHVPGVPGVLQVDGQLAVINTGPAPITVRTATGQGPGALVQGTGKSQLIRPGETGWIDVMVRFDCTPIGKEPLPMRFSVETGDGQIREVSYPVALEGSIWHIWTPPACAHLREVEKQGG